MRILLDECVPRKFAELIDGHEVRTVPEMGWSSIKNGDLLLAASREFDLMITVDKKMAEQQDSSKLGLPVIILSARSTQLKHLRPLVPTCKSPAKFFPAPAPQKLSLLSYCRQIRSLSFALPEYLIFRL